MGHDFDDRVEGKGKVLELYKLANGLQHKNTSVISRLGEYFQVELELPIEYQIHTIEFREPFVCIQVGGKKK
jgi:hypothetical protein